MDEWMYSTDQLMNMIESGEIGPMADPAVAKAKKQEFESLLGLYLDLVKEWHEVGCEGECKICELTNATKISLERKNRVDL